MGVYMDLLVAPRVPFTMTREQFSALVRDLLNEELVSMPCAILGGAVDSGCPLGMANGQLTSQGYGKIISKCIIKGKMIYLC